MNTRVGCLGFVLVAAAGSAVASNPLSFTDEAAARGVSYPLGSVVGNGWGSGMALSDLDNDGDLDIVVAGAVNGLIGVYENDGTGNFTSHSLTSGMGLMPKASGVSTVDYDNDGDLDVYIGSYLGVKNGLFRNDGGFTFTDVTAAAGIQMSCPGMASAWGDYNQDGHVDLYYSVRTLTGGDPTPNQLLRNNGDGTFTDVATALNVDSEDYPTLVPSFFDFDHDGDDDIYLGTDRGSSKVSSWTNRMYRNDGGTFTEVSVATNTLLSMDCMGIAVGDLTFDGYFDMYLTNSPNDGNFLMVYDNNTGAFVDETGPSGTIGAGFAWGTVFADFDNDTHLDTYVCSMVSENHLFRGAAVADWPMLNEAPGAGVNISDFSFCVAVGDIDGDNDLDMLVDENNSTLKVYINHSADAATNSWVRMRVLGKDTNLFALGTIVSVTSDGKTQMREARAGVNYKVADEQMMHFGLGGVSVIDSVVAEFNDGTMRTFMNMPSEQSWTLRPMSMMGDVNADGKINGRDIRAAMQAFTGAGILIAPGEEIFDMDGDFDIDAQDLLLMGLSNQRPGLNYTTRKPKN